MSSVIAKLACFGSQLMDGNDLNYYFGFLKEQLKTPVSRSRLYDHRRWNYALVERVYQHHGTMSADDAAH
jgi:hypothetical protein